MGRAVSALNYGFQRNTVPANIQLLASSATVQTTSRGLSRPSRLSSSSIIGTVTLPM
jgi:hypothetical protein